MSDQAKLAFLLSTCHKLSNGMFTVMTRQYEKSKTVATRHYFTLHINFRENTHPSNFYIQDAYVEFANSTDHILLEALQYHNSQVLTEPEMKLMYENLTNNNIHLNAYQMVAMYSIATLIKLYKTKNFKYIFIPVVINYGRDCHLLHQTSLIIDISNQCKMIYYEPYGNYTKYGKSYKQAVNTLLKCFDGFMCFKTGINYTTYHDMFNRPKQGIQQIMIEKNNANESVFREKFERSVAKLKELFPNENFRKSDDSPESADTDDKTVDILGVLYNATYFDLDNVPSDKKQQYMEVFNQLLTQYCCFNSKTCVSITIVEMDKFFKFSQETNHDTEAIKVKVDEMYTKYDIEYPNEVLMTEIYRLIDLFRYSKKVKDLLKKEARPSSICDKI
jgi:hypothetical protein